jgi:hypothetical protein
MWKSLKTWILTPLSMLYLAVSLVLLGTAIKPTKIIEVKSPPEVRVETREVQVEKEIIRYKKIPVVALECWYAGRSEEWQPVIVNYSGLGKSAYVKIGPLYNWCRINILHRKDTSTGDD